MTSAPLATSRASRSRRLAARLLLLVGAILLATGTWLLFTRAQSEELKRVTTLERVELARFQQLPVGASALLEGRLLAREPLGPQGFVAYTEEYFLRRESEGASKGREQWGSRAVPRPLIALERDGHVVDVCNRDYSLLRLAHDFQSDTTLRSGDLVHEPTTRRRGFKVGDALTVDGRVMAGAARSCIAAKAVSGGDPRAYIDAQREGGIVLRVVGAVFAGLGVLLLAVAIALRPMQG